MDSQVLRWRRGNNMSKKTKDLPDLESAMNEITDLVEKMEHGDLTLEQSLTHFERGVTLVKHCQKILTDAEQKVKILLEKNGKDTLADFDSADKDE
jgi:exodeoxyribonuclease VII small subunit